MKCQFDAFAGYVAEAETHSTENKGNYMRECPSLFAGVNPDIP